MSGSLPDSPAFRERRERTISLLCEHFAQDRITLDEFETRLDLAHKALAPRAADELLADIDAPEPATANPAQTTVAMPGSQDDTRLVLALDAGERRQSSPART